MKLTATDEANAWVHPDKKGKSRFEGDCSLHSMSMGRDQRDKYLAMLDSCFHQLAANPFMGKDCSHIRSGYRKNAVGSHVIFYRQTPADVIEIVRVLHGSMDIERRLSAT